MANFEADTRMKSDVCAQNGKNEMNSTMFNYTMSSFRNSDLNKDKTFEQFVTDNKNLRFKDGLSPAANLIDVDSRLRLNIELTHDKNRQQMGIRNFVAVPDMSRGEPAPILEHVLQSGEPTSVCGPLRETMYFEYPMNIGIQQMVSSESRALNTWDEFAIGESSKDILKRMRTGFRK